MSRAKMVSVDRIRVQLALMNEEPPISQKELAEKIDMNPQALSRALRAGRISETMLIKIADTLDRDPSSFSDSIPKREKRESTVTHEGSPRAFLVDDRLFFYTDKNIYTSLEKILCMACEAGFADKIREFIDMRMES